MNTVRDELLAVLARKDLAAREQRAIVKRLRAQACTAAVRLRRLPLTWSARGLQLRLETVSIGADQAVRCRVSARYQGRTLPLDNPFLFINPPTLVRDPAGPIARVVIDRVTRKPVTLRYREDPPAALQAAITRTVAALVETRRGDLVDRRR